MNKKGFTLTEILVVVAIIGVIVLIAVPSIISINNNIKERSLESKEELLINAAELYAVKNPNIFTSNVAEIKVSDLIDGAYINADVENGSSNCSSSNGCLINPVDNTSMNDRTIYIQKQQLGVTASLDELTASSESSATDLVQLVCDKLESNLIGKYGESDNDRCKCSINGATIKLVSSGGTTASGTEVNACIIAGNADQNYLEFNDTMWRIVGLYKLTDGNIYAKVITDDPIDIN